MLSEYLQVLFLAVLQGIGEFLPISSSGHLVIGKSLLAAITGKELSGDHGMLLEIALHVGTLGSILVVYFRDLLKLLRNPHLCAMIIVGTIPAAVVGLKYKSLFEEAFNSPMLVGCCLLLTASLLWLGQTMEREASAGTEVEQISWWKALLIGVFQAVALLPGVSRAGSTIVGGLVAGLKREAAARFSFFLAIPAIAGAAVLETKKLIEHPPAEAINWGPIAAGTVVSFFVGWLALRWLLSLIAKNRLHWFSIYCTVVGLATIAWQLAVRGN